MRDTRRFVDKTPDDYCFFARRDDTIKTGSVFEKLSEVSLFKYPTLVTDYGKLKLHEFSVQAVIGCEVFLFAAHIMCDVGCYDGHFY